MKTAIFCFLCFFFVSCTCQPSSKNNEEENFTNCADGVKDSLKAIVVDTTFILYPNLLTEKGSNGEAINPDSLSIKTEYDYYPLSTTEVEIVITNHSHYEYDCGEEYSLAYYNPAKQQWETLPTNPIVNSILWIFPSQHSTHEQTIRLYTSEVSNRPGKYRIYKAFNRKTKVAYAEFEMIEKGVEQLRNRIHDYMSNCMNSITAKNICMTYTKNTDTIFVVLINNAPRFQEMFKREVISYSAVNHGKIQKPTHFIPAASLDTLQITMKTEKPAYPAGTENIKVILTNNSPQRLFFGTAYTVARKVGKQWILLNAFNCWESLGILLDPKGTYRFVANLYPLFNDNPPGIYRVYKEVGFDGSSEKWFMAAEFSIE